MKGTAKQKALLLYERNYKKIYDIVCNLSQDEIDVLYFTDNSKYKKISSMSPKHLNYKE